MAIEIAISNLMKIEIEIAIAIFAIGLIIPCLKHSQYKIDTTQLKNFLGLKFPPFFLRRAGDRKRRQFQNEEVFQLNCVVLILTAL